MPCLLFNKPLCCFLLLASFTVGLYSIFAMAFKFEVIHEDKKTRARAGRIYTDHGIIETPVFMPLATRAVVKTLTVEELDSMGTQIVLGNTYHLYLRPGLEVIGASGGLHSFMNWNKPILTDSGGFQIFSLSETCKVNDDGVEFRSVYDGSSHFFSPQKAVEIQQRLGADIIMVLDECPPFPASENEVKEAVDRSFEWAKKCKESHQKEEQALFGIVQGGVYPALRKISVEKTAELDFPGYGIGGFSVGEPHDMMFDVLDQTIAYLPGNKPRYLMGVGNPTSLLEVIKQGIDMFDCALPTRMARNGAVFTLNGRLNIRNAQHKIDLDPLDKQCNCHVCSNYTRSYLRHLFMLGEILAHRLLTLHNLVFLSNLMKQARQSILEDRFDQFRNDFVANIDLERTSQM